jgi:hypothetical protein
LNGKWVPAASETLSANRAGQVDVVLGARISGRQLAPGRYRVVVQAQSGGQSSKPVDLPMTVKPPANGPHGQPRLLQVTMKPPTIVWRKGHRAPQLWLSFLLSRPATLQVTMQARVHGRWQQVAVATAHSGAGLDRLQLVGRWHGLMFPTRHVRLVVHATAAGRASVAKTFSLNIRHSKPRATGQQSPPPARQ